MANASSDWVKALFFLLLSVNAKAFSGFSAVSQKVHLLYTNFTQGSAIFVLGLKITEEIVYTSFHIFQQMLHAHTIMIMLSRRVRRPRRTVCIRSVQSTVGGSTLCSHAMVNRMVRKHLHRLYRSHAPIYRRCGRTLFAPTVLRVHMIYMRCAEVGAPYGYTVCQGFSIHRIFVIMKP